MHYGRTDFGIDGRETISSYRQPIRKSNSLTPIDIAELAKVYQPITKDNCFTQDLFANYVSVLEDRISFLEEERIKYLENKVTLTMHNDDYLQISGEGESREHQGGKMGLFTLLPGVFHNQKKVWILDRQA